VLIPGTISSSAGRQPGGSPKTNRGSFLHREVADRSARVISNMELPIASHVKNEANHPDSSFTRQQETQESSTIVRVGPVVS
jgi:hypothetical protein